MLIKMKPEIQFRLAQKTDSELLFHWRNDPETQKASLKSAPVSSQEHEEWFSKSLKNESRRIYLAEDKDNRPVGVIRTDLLGTDSPFDMETSWTIAPDARGQGFGKVILKEALKLTRGRVLARIKEENIASQKMAEYAEFTHKSTESGIQYWDTECYPLNKTGAIIQARMSSTRLPGKILKKLPYGSETTNLEQVLRRVKRTQGVDQVIVATTVEKEDQAIQDLCASLDVACYRGNLENVLSRYYETAFFYQIANVIRVTSDCPCLDPLILQKVLEKFKSETVDYVSNTVDRTFPRGMDVEVFTFEALKKANDLASEAFEKEHVTPYFYLNPEKKDLSVKQVHAAPKHHEPELRLTLDTPEDYAFLCAIYGELYSQNENFDLEAIMNLMHEKPWLKLITQNIVQKELKEASQ
jgi:spore coat polysaccharide biosynthesis protein SpsF